jgi:hypothetical protein
VRPCTCLPSQVVTDSGVTNLAILRATKINQAKSLRLTCVNPFANA